MEHAKVKSGDDAMVAYPLFQGEYGGSTPTSPLQFRLLEISPLRAMELNFKWHSVLPDLHHGNIVGSRRTAYYAAEFEGKFYAVAIWTDPIAANRLRDGDKILELRRFAISSASPKNTASRLLSVMSRLLRKKYPEIIKLISYQAVECHEGTIYKAAGWKAASRSEFELWHKDDPKDSSRRAPQTTSAKIRWEFSL
jgi:hypothetical protein